MVMVYGLDSAPFNNSFYHRIHPDPFQHLALLARHEITYLFGVNSTG